MDQSTKEIKKYSQIIISLGSFFVPFLASALNLALPSIGQEFHTSVYLLSWVTTGYILAAAAFLVPFGRFADIYGRRKIYLIGVTLLSFSAFLCSLAWSMKALIAFRLIQGIGASMIFATSMAILTSVFPAEERGKVLGINGACVYSGQSFAPVVGGALTHYFGWRSIFFVMFLAGLLIIYLIIFKMKTEWIGAPKEKFDYPGAVLYLTGIVILMYGFSSLAQWTGGKYFLLSGFLILFLFILHESKILNPILHLSLFTQNITFAFSNLAAFINYSATFAIAFLLSLYLQVGRGYNAQTAGLILLVQPVVMAIFTPKAGKLSDKFQPRILASLGMGITSLALFLFSFIEIDTSILLLTFFLIIIGLGFSLFAAPNNNAIMGSVPEKFSGIASSSIGTMRLTGQTVSMALVTLIITSIAGDIDIDPAHSDLLIKSAQISFKIFALTCFAGIFASLARGNLKSNKNLANEISKT